MLAMQFDSVMQVVAGGTANTVAGAAGADWALHETDTGIAINSGIDFSSFSRLSANAAGLVGTDGADLFTLQGNADSYLISYESMEFAGLTFVDGASGANEVNATGYSDALALTGSSNVLQVSSDFIFSNITTASIAELVGHDGDDEFTVTGSGVISSAGMSVAGLSTVRGVEGDNTLRTAGEAQFLQEGNGANAITYASAGDISFYDIGTISAGSVVSEIQNDEIVFVSSDVFRLNGIDVESVSFVDTGVGTDTITGLVGQDWIVLDEGSAQNENVTFQNVEILITRDADLVGRTSGEDFTLNSNGSVDVAGMNVSGMNAVNGLGDANTLDALNFADGLALTDNLGELDAGGLLFTGIDTIDVASLTGTSGAEQFDLDTDAALAVDGMRFNSVTSLNGAGGADVFASQMDDAWLLTSNSALVIHGDLVLTQVQELSGGSGRVIGDGIGHTFEVADTGLVNVGGVSFRDISNIDAAAGVDAVEGLDSVTLAENDGAFNSRGIEFIGIESAVAQTLVGTDTSKTYVLSGSGALSVSNIAFSGLTAVTGNGVGDQVNSRSGQGYALAADNRVQHDGIQFTGIEQFNGSSAALSVSGQDSAEISGAARVAAGNSTFDGVTALNLLGGSTDLQVWNGATLAGEGSVVSGGVAVTGVTTVSGTDAFAATGQSDLLTVLAENVLSAGGIVFSDVNTVAGGTGEDTVVGLATSDWALHQQAGSVAHAGMTFGAIERASDGSGHLVGADTDSDFTVLAGGALQAGAIEFADISSVTGGTAYDNVNSEPGGRWVLDNENGSATVTGIAFTGIEAVSTEAAIVDGSQNAMAEQYDLSATGSSVSVLDILFSDVAEVFSGSEDGDQVASAANSWQLEASGAVSANGVLFHGVEQVMAQNADLAGTGNDEEFILTGTDESIRTGTVTFSGIESVVGNGGNDAVIGTDNNEVFVLSATGDVSVAGTTFAEIARVDTGNGEDHVSGGGGQWVSATQGAAFTENSVIAQLESISLLFENLEQVSGTGTYSGPDFAADYVLSGPASITIGGVSFADVETIIAGSGNDTLHGLDASLQWTLSDSGNSVGDTEFSMVFSGIEAVQAGSGVDTFQLEGGVFDTVDTGAGADVVYMSGTLLDSLALGDGDDLLQLLPGSAPTVLSAGAGNDQLESQLAGLTWEITGDSSAQNTLGQYAFSGFEQLADAAGGLNLVTNQQLDFTVSDTNTGAGANFSAAGMTLEYNPAGNLALTSTSRETISGSLRAEEVELSLAGDLDIQSDIQSLNLSSGGANIDVAIVANEDLLIDQIDVGRGNVSLSSANFGVLTAETFGDVHITASNIQLGTQQQRWGNIGTEVNPLRMDASESVSIVAFSYFEPSFVGGQPQFSATGDQLESVAGAQTAQGLKSAIQNPVDDIAQLDPGIFSEVTPYSLGVEAVNLPEVRLHGGELMPMQDEEDEEEREASAAEENAMVPVPVLESAMLMRSPGTLGGQ
ncbi:hypothetical protein GCM10008940_11840 [Microbulbifer agarilyticus]